MSELVGLFEFIVNDFYDWFEGDYVFERMVVDEEWWCVGDVGGRVFLDVMSDLFFIFVVVEIGVEVFCVEIEVFCFFFDLVDVEVFLFGKE